MWTDGRYFIQAENQLQGTTIDLMKQGEEGVPTMEEYLYENVFEHGTVGFDGRVMNTARVEKLADKLQAKKDVYKRQPSSIVAKPILMMKYMDVSKWITVS